MKKLVQMLLVVCMVVLGAQVALAASDKETIQEGADLASIHRLAIGLPKYVPVAEKPPTKEEVAQAIADASKVARSYVISYDAAAEGIRGDKGIDIKALDRRKAETEFKNGIAKIADAYVVMTVANNTGITCFFDIYKAGTNELLYTYQVVGKRYEKDSVSTYKSLSEEFFKHFEKAAEEQQKKNAREAKKKK